MTDAINSALTGLNAASLRQAVSANNVANATTPGFAAGRVTQSDLAGGGTQVADISAAGGAAAFEFTGIPFDLAIDGMGWFAFRGGDGGSVFSRVGSLGQDGQGFLVDRSSGRRLLGAAQGGPAGPIHVDIGGSSPHGAMQAFSVSANGAVMGHFADGTTQEIARISLARFANEGGLVSVGGNAVLPGPNSGEPVLGHAGAAPFGRLVQGALQGSNTDIARERVDQSVNAIVFKANIAVIKTQKELFDELMNLG
ncbi:MAG: flagellar hook basal-body protein [Planctomycetota bacterium]|nr:flagellar hook basal-body protein [Planctomycetota bacterium]